MRYSLLRFRRPALICLGVFCLAGAGVEPALGQVPAPVVARLRGVIADAASDQPLELATVSILGSSHTVTTDRSGSFEISVPAGPVALHVTAPGRSSVVVDTEVLDDGTSFVRVALPTFAVALSELLVQARAPDHSPAAASAADLVARQIPRSEVNPGQVGQGNFALSLRLASSFRGPQAPTIVLDGVALSQDGTAFDVLDRIPAAEVEKVEVLRGPSAAFLYPLAANGVIIVTTLRGQGR